MCDKASLRHFFTCMQCDSTIYEYPCEKCGYHINEKYYADQFLKEYVR